jgi:ribosome biogenesis GTPase
MNLEDIGYNSTINTYVEDSGLDKSSIGRVVAVFRDIYHVGTVSGELKATITGNLQNSISEKSELPIVGDWVCLNKYDDNNAFITQVFPRNNFIERRSKGKSINKQAIAANIDFGFIVEAVTENFNINRIERYLAICNSANVKPIILLTKTDLVTKSALKNTINDVKKRVGNVPIFAFSNLTKIGIDELKASLLKSKTYCLLGLSGVGKSTLLNILAEKTVMKTSAISQSTHKGVHTTTHRQLFLLKNGSIIIDNPGMREVGITDSTIGVEITFEKIYELAGNCRFSDCTHSHEKDCAVLAAVESGILDKATYSNYIKMRKEQFHYKSSLVEKRKQDKTFGKMVKNFKKNTKLKK